ncbi:hypothetical protein Ciccas_010560 [Cichlidogyrus casuarinus]|uniref:C2H2-type domain-containing protein n=1 Tax=Cichlidogyrus casuarinus TaxID=1844966 RepID=A0ABD2PYE9_9PLAT
MLKFGVSSILSDQPPDTQEQPLQVLTNDLDNFKAVGSQNNTQLSCTPLSTSSEDEQNFDTDQSQQQNKLFSAMLMNLIAPSLPLMPEPTSAKTRRNRATDDSPQNNDGFLTYLREKTGIKQLEYVNNGAGIKNPVAANPKMERELLYEKYSVQISANEFMCKACGKRFNLIRLLNRHIKCHSEMRRYLCKYCFKGFNDTFDLKRHTRTHTGVRPYKCMDCGKAFTQRCSLESHSKKLHNRQLAYNYKERRAKLYICEECGYTTMQPEQFFLHTRNEHAKSKAESSKQPQQPFPMSIPDLASFPQPDMKHLMASLYKSLKQCCPSSSSI